VIPPGVEIFLALAPIDLRWGFDRLAGLVESQLGRRPRSGALFVFFGKRRTALKVLHYDGSGLCLYYKRLDRGSFRIPEAFEEGACQRTPKLIAFGTAKLIRAGRDDPRDGSLRRRRARRDGQRDHE
jgi:transposase